MLKNANECYKDADAFYGDTIDYLCMLTAAQRMLTWITGKFRKFMRASCSWRNNHLDKYGASEREMICREKAIMEYIIWCDESDKRGDLFSNFYGGALVSSIHANEVIARLNQKNNELNLFGEIKWAKITETYQNKYIALIDEFFSLIAQCYVKIRIIFTDNTIVPVGLTKQQQEDEYFLIYYQFIKFDFGLLKVQHNKNTKLRINFDNALMLYSAVCHFV
jgi:hypothetical protein